LSICQKAANHPALDLTKINIEPKIAFTVGPLLLIQDSMFMPENSVTSEILSQIKPEKEIKMYLT
jgi:hypothetical protein